MARKYLIAFGVMSVFVGPSAEADMPVLPPNYTTGIIAPVLMNHCNTGTCSGNPAPRQRQQQNGIAPETKATCANARQMTPKPEQKAKHSRLISLCTSIGL